MKLFITAALAPFFIAGLFVLTIWADSWSNGLFLWAGAKPLFADFASSLTAALTCIGLGGAAYWRVLKLFP